MRIWCVDHAGLSWNIRSDLYFIYGIIFIENEGGNKND